MSKSAAEFPNIMCSRIGDEIRRGIEEAAKERNISVSMMMRLCLRRGLEFYGMLEEDYDIEW